MCIIKYKDYYSTRFNLKGINDNIFKTAKFIRHNFDCSCALKILKKYNMPLNDEYIIYDFDNLISYMYDAEEIYEID